jgi:DNA-binding GntR family transcriptional regulator
MVAFSYRGSEPAEQHKALLEAALKRDVATATATLRTHVNNCVEHALEHDSFIRKHILSF